MYENTAEDDFNSHWSRVRTECIQKRNETVTSRIEGFLLHPCTCFYIPMLKVLKSLSFSLSVRHSEFVLWFCDSVQSFILGLEVTQHGRNNSSLISLGHVTTESLNVYVCICVYVCLCPSVNNFGRRSDSSFGMSLLWILPWCSWMIALHFRNFLTLD